MKKYIVLLLIAVLIAPVLIAADTDNPKYNPIQSSVYSLGISPDAVASGMGDAGAATTPDVYSQHWNPSKYAFLESQAGFSLSYTPWLSQLASDINLMSLMGYYKLDDQQSLSGSLRYFSLGEVILRQMIGDVGYTIQPYEMEVDLAYSRMLSERFSMAVSLRYIRSDLMSGEDPAGNAFAADISGYHRIPVYFGRERGNVALGFNISNIGTKISYDGGNINHFLPTNLKLGGSLHYPMDAYNSFTFAMDVNKLLIPTPDSTSLDMYGQSISPIQGIFQSFSDAPRGFEEELEEIYGSIGVEYVYNQQFFLRSGYYYEHLNKGNRSFFTFGAGFKMSMFRLDASYLVSQHQSNPLDGTLRFSLAFDMEGIRQLTGR
ncbi:MAG: type IX secretion system outer membrane channel protein PorV [Bacteroidales bacterium]|nr:type IX secretion system outer membrane channel protein PorV [Bacteroidales bacterium]HKL92815.1 type IX secretion system outer membrane channel protein PorV [Bacteroidales bacterium]